MRRRLCGSPGPCDARQSRNSRTLAIARLNSPRVVIRPTGDPTGNRDRAGRVTIPPRPSWETPRRDFRRRSRVVGSATSSLRWTGGGIAIRRLRSPAAPRRSFVSRPPADDDDPDGDSRDDPDGDRDNDRLTGAASPGECRRGGKTMTLLFLNLIPVLDSFYGVASRRPAPHWNVKAWQRRRLRECETAGIEGPMT